MTRKRIISLPVSHKGPFRSPLLQEPNEEQDTTRRRLAEEEAQRDKSRNETGDQEDGNE